MKTQYIKPVVETLPMVGFRLLASLSKGTDPNNPPEGDAKENTFIDEPSWVGSGAWENLAPETDEAAGAEQ